jgi:hypothetical protein
MFSLESLVTQRIGFGRFQVKALLILGTLDINDGAELMAITFINPIIRHYRNLTN